MEVAESLQVKGLSAKHEAKEAFQTIMENLEDKSEDKSELIKNAVKFQIKFCAFKDQNVRLKKKNLQKSPQKKNPS